VRRPNRREAARVCGAPVRQGLAPERAAEVVRAKHGKSDYVFCKLWGLVTDERNLRIAVARVTRNRVVARPA